MSTLTTEQVSQEALQTTQWVLHGWKSSRDFWKGFPKITDSLSEMDGPDTESNGGGSLFHGGCELRWSYRQAPSSLEIKCCDVGHAKGLQEGGRSDVENDGQGGSSKHVRQVQR